MNRKPIEELRLTGSHNLARSLEREAEKQLSPDTKKRLSKIDKLIEQTLAECAEGGSVGPLAKRNPAFANLESLMRTRKMLLKENLPEVGKSDEELLEEIDALTPN
jgi:hypothetical protein